MEGEIKATSYYESEIRSGQLTIKQFSENPYSNYERVLSSQKKYEKGKPIEYINYHPTFPGSESFCFRYEYH